MRNDKTSMFPKPVPPTEEMIRIREEMRDAEKSGDDLTSGKLLTVYVDMRRAQVTG